MTNKISTVEQVQEEITRLAQRCLRASTPSRSLIASELRSLADRIAAEEQPKLVSVKIPLNPGTDFDSGDLKILQSAILKCVEGYKGKLKGRLQEVAENIFLGDF